VLKTLSIYIHYPFCKSKCPYCDFNSHVKEGVDHQGFLRAYEIELENFFQKTGPRKVKTIFFGGGTPSLMPIFLVEGILQKISRLWGFDANCEISLEANPTSFEASKFKDLRRVGVNRLSLGIQALNDKDLKFLGREHSSAEAISTIEVAAKIFDNFSFDLIYTRPEQTLRNWEAELKRAIGFGTKHLSLYQLTIEKGTRFFTDFRDGKFAMPDEELSSDFYELTNHITEKANFNCYEISNYAKSDESQNYQSQHNLTYWRGDDYIGVGAGAHSRIYFENEKERSAISMLCEPITWLKKVEEDGMGIQKIEKVSAAELMEELILMGLRLEEGILEKSFQEHFGKKFSEIFDIKKLQRLEEQKLILIESGCIKITKDKRILSDAIIKKIVEILQ
jgi:putative oxygen-independent coproporphyrinogen III oxidase